MYPRNIANFYITKVENILAYNDIYSKSMKCNIKESNLILNIRNCIIKFLVIIMVPFLYD